jgi:hypothetical protein
VLQHRINFADTMPRLLGVSCCDDRLEQMAPENRFGCVVWIGLRQPRIAAGFFQPQFQWTFVGAQANGRSGAGTADAGFANIEPVSAAQAMRFHEA